MTYTRYHDDWQDGVAGGTPITEAALDHIEAGLLAESTRGDSLAGQLDAFAAADITDSTSVGRAVLTAATAGDARDAIGGLGTVTAADITDSTSTGRAVMTAADAGAVRATAGLTSAAVMAGLLGALVVDELPASPNEGDVYILVAP